MIPNKDLITISNNIDMIIQFINDVICQPRMNILKWSEITHQTSNIKIGYPGQHLSSLITGMKGQRTGARGKDICDGTEVKSCSRVDQMDKCKQCKGNVSRQEATCSNCGSNDIDRKNDSKRLFSVKSEDELNLLVNQTDRILLLLSHYPKFDTGDYSDIQIDAFEIWPKSERQNNFTQIMANYYYKIFLEHIKINPQKTPAPKNFWPFQYQFYLCNPIKTFSVYIKDYDNNPTFEILKYVSPEVDRSNLESENLPISLLKKDEILMLKNSVNEEDSAELMSEIQNGYISEKFKYYLPLRDTDKISTAKEKYTRT